MQSLTLVSMKSLYIVFGILATHFSHSQDLESIQSQLERIELQSLALRSQVMLTLRQFGSGSPEMDSLNRQIIAFDSISVLTVTAIIDQHGWLGKKQIGKAANRALFLTIQHAADNGVRKKYFPLLKASAEKGDSERSHMATMQDRLLVQAGEPQIYGTQSHRVNGQLELFPIKDPEGVNKRRKKVGMAKLK